MAKNREDEFKYAVARNLPNRYDMLRIAAFLVMLLVAFGLGMMFKEYEDKAYVCKYHLKNMLFDVYAVMYGNSSNYTLIDVINVSK